ncbi:MAG: NADH-quinone oxidoreductase subunit M [Actinomycetaceae bacterium]|nr:NADH-quinone oxidoreductase subunit M [Actinomycetaceae bacterium]
MKLHEPLTVVDSPFPLLSLMVALPAVVALLLWLVPSLHQSAREIGLATSLVVLAGAVYAVCTFDYTQAGAYQFAETYSWIPQLGVSWAMGVNGMGLSMIVLSALLVPIVFAADWHREGLAPVESSRGVASVSSAMSSAEDDDNDLASNAGYNPKYGYIPNGGYTSKNIAGYVALTLVSLAFMMMIFAARDILVFYLAFEAMLVPMYFLIGYYGQGAARKAAALKFLLYSLAGGLVMLIGVVAIYVYAPKTQGIPTDLYTVDFLYVNLNLPGVVETWIFVTFFFAFAVKAPMVPLHTWLADAAENARPATSSLLVGVMDKIGTFGMIAFCLTLFPNASNRLALPIVVLAIVSILWGALAALAQKDILRLISFTSVSHFGLMVMGIFIGNKTALMGTMIYMVAHGLSIAAMFLLAGFMSFRGATQRIDGFGGLQRVTPVLAGTFLISGLAAIALPGLSGFVPELLVLVGSYRVAPWAAVFAVLAVVLAAVYILLPYQKIFTGPIQDHVKDMPDLNKREKWAVIAPLIAFMLVLGLFPKPLVDMVSPVADQSVLAPMTTGQVGTVDLDNQGAEERTKE